MHTVPLKIMTPVPNDVKQWAEVDSGKYRIQAKLAQNNSCTVYKAAQTDSLQTVALKVLRAAPSDDCLCRFVHEAQTLASLSHPNIVSLRDFGIISHNPFIAMEWVPGKTLKSIVQETGPLQTSQCLAFLTQACHALDHVHALGLVHGDIKPSNMMYIDVQKMLKLLDFGLAAKSQSLSQPNMGTPLYLSPEQVLGHKMDARSDIYMLGITLYELATGALPFLRGDLHYKHAYIDPPSPSVFEPNIHKDLERMILRMIKKRPDERYQSCNDILRELDQSVYRVGL